MNDDDFMRMAIEESKKGDSLYGAVLVKDGVDRKKIVIVKLS